MEAEAHYAQLRELVATIPDFGRRGDPLPDEGATLVWLGRLHALIEEDGLIVESATLNIAMDSLTTLAKERSVNTIKMALHKALARAELKAPATAQGAFIAAGSAFDALAAIAKVLGSAKANILIVDPYLNERVLTDFATMAAEGVHLELIAAANTVKPGLLPAAQAWAQQYQANRPLQFRLAPPQVLHDRLIIVDRDEVWDLTQSIKDFAARTPATLSRAPKELALLKIDAYVAIWGAAQVLI